MAILRVTQWVTQWVPQGFKLVPVQMTDAMASAAGDISDRQYADLLGAAPAATVQGAGEAVADLICQQVAELPDRSSPDDQPDMMLVTADELRDIVLDALATNKEQSHG